MKVNILFLVFNDWESLNYLLKDFDRVKIIIKQIY